MLEILNYITVYITLSNSMSSENNSSNNQIQSITSRAVSFGKCIKHFLINNRVTEILFTFPENNDVYKRFKLLLVPIIPLSYVLFSKLSLITYTVDSTALVKQVLSAVNGTIGAALSVGVLKIFSHYPLALLIAPAAFVAKYIN